jgi:hypothetical protein
LTFGVYLKLVAAACVACGRGSAATVQSGAEGIVHKSIGLFQGCRFGIHNLHMIITAMARSALQMQQTETMGDR